MPGYPAHWGLEMIVFAQLSDLHLDGSNERAGRAAAVITYLNGLSMPVDAVLVTGDIADHGLPAEYEQARAILSASRSPVFCCPGNHDARAAYREVLLGDHGPADPAAPVNQVHCQGGALVALCDSTIPDRDDGYLADETISWLDGVLAGHRGTASLVCFHHPPAALHSPDVDTIRQFGEQRLAGVIAGHPQVVAILCGHAHTPAATSFAGRPLLVAPGVASTLVLPWEHGGGTDDRAPAAIAFHLLDDHQRLVTHYRVVT
jgi:Icc protein